MMINRTSSSNSRTVDFNIIVQNCGIPATQTWTTIFVGLVFSLYLKFAIYVGFDGLTFYFEDYGVSVTLFIVLGLWAFAAERHR